MRKKGAMFTPEHLHANADSHNITFQENEFNLCSQIRSRSGASHNFNDFAGPEWFAGQRLRPD